LQLPVLKDALTNSDFFLDDSQPARHVIDLLARCGVFWEFLPGNEVADTVREQVVRLREASREGRDGFPEAAASLTRFLADLEARYEARLQSSLANVTAQERRAEAMPEVDRSLDEWFSAGPIEETLANFLRGPWRSVLCEYVVERADQPEACDTAFAQTSLLIWSVLPKTGPVEREHLLKQLPGLLQLLNAGLDRIHYGKDEREPFLKFLMARHAQVIRPAPANPAPPPIPIPKLAPPDQTEPVATVKRWNAQQLALGDWLTLEQPPGKIRRYRLSWISPKRTKFVLTARESSEALALNDGEVEAWLRSGALKLVDSAPIVQRAISASFESR
jgi:hypothetical protein